MSPAPAPPTLFLIDGTAWAVVDWYLPDASVGMFGEAGAWVCLAGTPGDVEIPDEAMLFVVGHDLTVYDHTGNTATGQTATVLG